MSLETREIKLFWRDIPGFCRDIPGVPEKFEKEVCFQFSSPDMSAENYQRIPALNCLQKDNIFTNDILQGGRQVAAQSSKTSLTPPGQKARKHSLEGQGAPANETKERPCAQEAFVTQMFDCPGARTFDLKAQVCPGLVAPSTG